MSTMPEQGRLAVQVTVTDNLPIGVTATAAVGTGWTTNISIHATPGGFIRSLRRAAYALTSGGNSYPTLTLTVQVANNASASVTNTATVSGGGEVNTANDTATNPTSPRISPQVPDVIISFTHNGIFRSRRCCRYRLHEYCRVGNEHSPGPDQRDRPSDGNGIHRDEQDSRLPVLSATGTGWTTSIVGSTLTATRNDSLMGGGTYPVLTLTVGVSSTAPGSATNSAAGGRRRRIEDCQQYRRRSNHHRPML